MVRRSLPVRWLLVLLCLWLVGCSRIPFVSSRYDNFTAYYNTFYNARKAYERGIEAIERQNDPVDRDHYLPLFTTPDRVSNTRDFDAAIRKSADVLRDHPESKWVDDALLLIGKSYFYLKNYVGAEQKFQEVISLGSALEDEARFWLARTLIAGGSYEAAAEHLRLSLAREALSDRWEPMLRLALGELYVQQQAWTEAVAELEEGLSRVRDRELGARAQFLLAQVYETLGAYEQAAEAYRRVDRYRPLYELSYAAQVSAIRVEGEHGDPERALRDLRRMERDDKNFTNRAELAYLRGRIYQAMGLADDAFVTYDELLYDADPNMNITGVRGRVHYALGELYRDAYRDFLMASAHFDTAATALRSGGRSGGAQAGRAAADLPAPAAIRDADEQAEVFRTFAAMARKVSELDSLLYLGSLDQEAFQDRILELRRARAEELAAQQRELERQQAQQRFQNTAVTRPGRAGGNPGPDAAGTGGEAGFLFHNDPARVQEGRITFINRWGNRPLVPNWRREEAVAMAVSEGREAEGENAFDAGPAVLDPAAGLPQIDVSAVPRDSLRRAAMRAERAMARYEMGNILFLSMARPDSAAAWYRLVIEEDQDQPVAQRAYYALAEVQRALGDTLAARRLDQYILTTYPDSELARRLRTGTRSANEPSPADSLARAERAYADAYRRWQQAGLAAALNDVLDVLPWYLPPLRMEEPYPAALNEMLGVAARFPATEIAPRALLAAGSIYMEWARHEALDLFGRLPLALPDSLLERTYLVETPAAANPTPPAGEWTVPTADTTSADTLAS
ncbi:MAG: hypothetical protein D6685_10870, partial [Bacteroidetes bacterium]